MVVRFFLTISVFILMCFAAIAEQSDRGRTKSNFVSGVNADNVKKPFQDPAQDEIEELDLGELSAEKTNSGKDLQMSDELLTRNERWGIILPGFVIHGVLPDGGINKSMPRRIDDGGRSVVTPGVGLEYRGHETLNIVAAMIKDCYDSYAGTIQIGQSFKLTANTEYGYTLGLYIRETPVQCLTQTETTSVPTGRRTPPKINTIVTTTCAFSDNLPVRYIFQVNNSYIDVIPSPFFNVTTRVFSGPFEMYLKLMSNYYFNEFGLVIPF